ncbi:MAG: LysR family transcriptional regulator [Lachnospiraceae bacterium]|nr:LysR family transcriptional regulator [Ruminococcus sp.]MCM1274574.1 LysR family transcriptional regulator [Lachnospiraceae bacterium]
MTLQQIKYVITVAEKGSISRAAEALFITQSALSCAVRELENEIGAAIFLRTAKGVTLTPDGTDFLVYASRVYRQYELLREKYGKNTAIKRKFGVSTQHYSFAVKAFVEMVKRFDTLTFDFAIRETKTLEVISDVGSLKSEIGILYKSDFNGRIIEKMLADNGLEFLPLIECSAYVYLWKNHPLARESSLSLEQLSEYPCLSFEQGDGVASYFAEEILGDREYPRVIRSSDRATQLNLMVGLNGYTLCSGITCDELNGEEYTTVPFREDEENRNSVMEIGYIRRKYNPLSDIAEVYVEEVKRYLNI